MAILEHYTLMALAVVFGFSWLVFVHELGHYLLAKWNGVRVHVFSIGMGPYLLSFQKGETLYVLSLVPIGGYVKMAGQDDMKVDLAATKDPKDYRNKRPGQRAAILAAGAAFNLIFAYLGFALCYYIGVEMPAPILGKVDPQSPLAQAVSNVPGGKTEPNPLQEGDVITTVNGDPIKHFFELTMAIGSAGSNRDIIIQYQRKDPNGRDDVPSRLPAIVRTEKDVAVGAASVGLTQYEERVEYPVGFTCREGVYVYQLAAFSEDGGPNPAEAAGINPGDSIVKIDGQELTSQHQVSELVKKSDGRELSLLIERDSALLDIKVTPRKVGGEGRYLMGIQMMAANPVDQIAEDCEAFRSGLRKGAFLRHIQESLDQKTLTVFYQDTLSKNAKTKEIEIPWHTASSAGLILVQHKLKMTTLEAPSMARAMGMAWGDTVGHSTMVFVVLHRLITREVDFKNMAGPVGMAGILTTVASRRSFAYYLWFLALLSLNLGVLQFVPIPLLDGWHLLMVGVEKLKGSQVSVRVQEAFQYVGLFLILTLLLLVTWNDIMRFFVPS